MSLPNFLQPYLWSYDIRKIDKNRNRETIITAILNLGDEKAIKWLFNNYSLNDIKSVLRNPRRGMWHKISLLYWQKVLGVEAPKFKQELAYINLDPLANIDLYKKFFKISS